MNSSQTRVKRCIEIWNMFSKCFLVILHNVFFLKFIYCSYISVITKLIILHEHYVLINNYTL